MKTIKEPRENIAKIWGAGKRQDQKKYRLLRYLIRKDTDDGVLLHNVVTGHLILLSESEAGMIGRLPAERTDEMTEMIESHFLVPEDYDEHEAVLKLRKLMRMTDRKKNITGYTILPTTNCNARCFYCYEADFRHINMTEQIAHKTVVFIKEHCGEAKKVSLSWFGGEPTVASNRIDRICTELNDEGIEFTSSMISNGYLLDEEMAEKAKNLWKLQSIQITLDGTEEVYNRVKAYKAVTDSPYRTVLRNIGYLLEREIRVSVRMNLDRHNAEDLRDLIDELAERFEGQKLFSCYVHPLFDNCGYETVEHSDDDRLWLWAEQKRLNERIREKTGKFESRKSFPSLAVSHCMADNNVSAIIGPDGNLSKCEHTTEDVFGNLDEGWTDKASLEAWKETKEYPECPGCALFPSCIVLKRCFSSTECFESKRDADMQSAELGILSAFDKWKCDKQD